MAKLDSISELVNATIRDMVALRVKDMERELKWKIAVRARMTFCKRLGVSISIPTKILLDLAEDKLDVWEQNELQGCLAELRVCEV